MVVSVCKPFLAQTFKRDWRGNLNWGRLYVLIRDARLELNPVILLTFDWTVPEALLDVGKLLPSESERDVLLPFLLRVPDLPGNLRLVLVRAP